MVGKANWKRAREANQKPLSSRQVDEINFVLMHGTKLGLSTSDKSDAIKRIATGKMGVLDSLQRRAKITAPKKRVSRHHGKI